MRHSLLGEKNIMTAEDPVGFYMPGINQVNIKEEIGLNFAGKVKIVMEMLSMESVLLNP